MATESTIPLTDGDGGSQLHTANRTISSVSVEDQAVIPAEHFVKTYSVSFTNISVATANDHIVSICADGTNYIRLQHIFIQQHAFATARALDDICVFRISTTPTGGTSVSARPFQPSDTDPWGGDVRTLPSAKGTEGNQMLKLPLWLAQSAENTLTGNRVEWQHNRHTQPIIVGTATTAGLVIKTVTACAAATVTGYVIFTATDYL